MPTKRHKCRITLDWLEQHYACDPSLKRFARRFPEPESPPTVRQVIQALYDCTPRTFFEWSNDYADWLLQELFYTWGFLSLRSRWIERVEKILNTDYANKQSCMNALRRADIGAVREFEELYHQAVSRTQKRQQQE